MNWHLYGHQSLRISRKNSNNCGRTEPICKKAQKRPIWQFYAFDHLDGQNGLWKIFLPQNLINMNILKPPRPKKLGVGSPATFWIGCLTHTYLLKKVVKF